MILMTLCCHVKLLLAKWSLGWQVLREAGLKLAGCHSRLHPASFLAWLKGQPSIHQAVASSLASC